MTGPSGIGPVPALDDLLDQALASDTPPKQDAKTRVDRVIRLLQGNGHESITSLPDLVVYMAETSMRVQRGESGFDLSYRYSPDDPLGKKPASRLDDGTARIFYAGRVRDPADPGNDKKECQSRPVAEQLAQALTNDQGRPITLEKVGEAGILDELAISNDLDMQRIFETALAEIAFERPDIAAAITGPDGTPNLGVFHSLVWKEGLSTQYAQEASGPIYVVNPMPYENQTWYTHERPTLLAKGIDRKNIHYIGFTHQALTAQEKFAGKHSQPLPGLVGQLNDLQADKYIWKMIRSSRKDPDIPEAEAQPTNILASAQAERAPPNQSEDARTGRSQTAKPRRRGALEIATTSQTPQIDITDPAPVSLHGEINALAARAREVNGQSGKLLNKMDEPHSNGSPKGQGPGQPWWGTTSTHSWDSDDEPERPRK